jgi:hypothetical protein
MDTRTANQDPTIRWRAAAQAAVRQRPPVHDRGTGAAAKAPAPEKAQPVIALPSVAVMAARFVSLQLAAVMIGRTEKAIERKIERGIWIEGKHYRKRDGGIYIDMDAYTRWVEDGK